MGNGSMGNGETIMPSSIGSDVSDDTSRLAQDGAGPDGSVRLPPAPQLVVVPSQGAGGPLAIEIQPSQSAPVVQRAQVAPPLQQPRAAPAVHQPRAAVQPPPPPPIVKQAKATPNPLGWVASDVRPSQGSPVVDQPQPEASPDPQTDPVSSVTIHDLGYGSGRARTGLFTKVLGTAAVVSFGAVAMWALSSVLFPNAPKDEVREQSPILVPAPQDVSDQREQAPSDNSQSADNSQSGPDATPATQVEQATYVVANAGQTAQPLAQNDQQQPLQPQQPQPQAQQQQQPNQLQPTTQQQVSNEQAEPPRPQQKSEPTLSSKEVDRLTNLGQKFLAQGDLATARRVLEHAALAHGARAALLLGATYDPDGLRKMGVVGMRPDLEKAHMWYKRAVEFGSSEASQRLAALAQQGH